MRGGAIDSKGPPEALYESPPTAWSAAFLGRGPVLEILALEGGGPSPVARTAIGAFDCAGAPPVPVAPLPAAAPGSPRMSLFFPASAPRPATRTPPPREGSGGDVARNRIRGRVASDSFAGSCRRVSLACPIVSGGELILELELPPSFKPAIGELLELRVDSGLCRILPGSPS